MVVEWSPEEQEKSSSTVSSATCGGAHGSIALDTRERGERSALFRGCTDLLQAFSHPVYSHARCSDHTDSSTYTACSRALAPGPRQGGSTRAAD